MSGSGGGGGGGGVPVDNTPCDQIDFESQVTSPKSNVVKGLAIDIVLDVVLEPLNGVVVVQVKSKGALVGGLTGPDVRRMRKCLEEGYKFKATVLSINGGQVRVRVESA